MNGFLKDAAATLSDFQIQDGFLRSHSLPLTSELFFENGMKERLDTSDFENVD